MKTDIHIVSTKVLNKELVHQLVFAGLRLTNMDFIRKEIRIPDYLDQISIHRIIVLTTKTAVQAWMEIARRMKIDVLEHPVYCLASATLELALQSGLTIAGFAPDSSALADIILKDPSVTAVTFVCSNIRRNELPDKLKSNGILVEEIHAYKTEFNAIKIEKPPLGVIFFSPSAVDSFLILNSLSTAVAFCLGKTTANHAAESGFNEIYISDEPTPESLVKTVINYFKKETVHAQK